MWRLPKNKAAFPIVYWDIGATIDGREVGARVGSSPREGIDHWTRKIAVKPGGDVEFKMKLKDYFRIPKNWHRIEIDSADFGMCEISGKMILVRPYRRPAAIPRNIWMDASPRVRKFLIDQQKRIDQLKAKPSR